MLRLFLDLPCQSAPLTVPAFGVRVRDAPCNGQAPLAVTAVIDLAAQDPGQVIIHILMIEMDLLPAALGE